VRQTCDGPNGGFYFKEAGRIFQVEVYVGFGAGPALRSRVAAMLNSLRVLARTLEFGVVGGLAREKVKSS
jgi:hypothetical protein